MLIGLETWLSIPGFPGYEVSECGNIRSIRRVNPKILNVEVDRDGYRRVQLRRNGVPSHQVLSRLVALTFIGEPTHGQVCCHNDGNPANNAASNLRWDTQLGNIADKVIHGTAQVGSKHPNAEITESDARRIKEILSQSKKRGSLKKAAIETGISYHIVADISRGKTWGHA